MKKTVFGVLSVLVFAAILTIPGCAGDPKDPASNGSLPTFTSEEALVSSFIQAQSQGYSGIYYAKDGAMPPVLAPAAAASGAAGAANDASYSGTNVQVAGVDEADIVKTDGKYIYTVSGNTIYLALAYPAESAKIIGQVTIPGFTPQELFVEGDRLVVFGSTYSTSSGGSPTILPADIKSGVAILPYPVQTAMVSVKLYDIKDRSNPKLLKSFDIEGSYLTSRKIGTDVYFVVNSYPSYTQTKPTADDLIPGYRETVGDAKSGSLEPIAAYNQIGYIAPVQAAGFLTIASLSMTDVNKEVGKTVVVGSGENVYASTDSLYIAQTSWPVYSDIGMTVADNTQGTVVTKFSLVQR